MYFSGSDQRLVGYGAGGKAEAPPGFGATRGADEEPGSHRQVAQLWTSVVGKRAGFGTRDTRTHKTKSFCVFSSCLWMISVSQHNTSCSTAWEPALVMGECLLMVITHKHPICQCQQGWEKRFRLFRAGAPLKYKDIRNTSGQWPSWLSVNVSRTSFGIYGAILTNLHNITSFHWFCVRIVWFIRSVWTSGLGSNGNSANWSDLGCRDLRVRFKDMGNSRFKWYGDCQHFL